MEWNSVPAVASARNAVRARWVAARLQPPWLRVLSIAAPAAWLLTTIWFVAFEGLPLTRDFIAAWVVLGLLAVSLSDIRGWLHGVIFEWLPFFALLALYDLLRGVADGLVFHAFYLPQIDVDQFLFFGTVPTVWLQEHLYTPGTLPWYGIIAWAVYMSHFFATPLLAMVLWKLDRPRFRRYAVTVGALSLIGFATYALYPAAPPWMASERGLIGPVARVVPEIWGLLGVDARFGVLGTGYEYANDVAAVPSLHAAFSLLVALELFPRGPLPPGHRSLPRLAARVLLVAYPLTMAFGLVYSGEHYVSDILLGWLYALICFFGVRAAFRRWQARRRAEPALTSASFPPSSL
ncbi:MAG TPA: phosphatase PAP2 family protein [Conexibacter sp.]|jgi:hypothetical protein